MITPDTSAFRRLARAQKAYEAAYARALDAGATAAAVKLEAATRQLNAMSDFAELIYGDTEEATQR